MMGEMTLWMLLGLLVIAAVIGGAIYLAIRAGVGEHGRAADAKATLRGRLAAGEISTEEYRKRTAALADSAAPTPAGDGRDT